MRWTSIAFPSYLGRNMVLRASSIALMCTSDEIGGMERVVCSLARGLAARKIPVDTYISATAGSDALVEWCKKQGVCARPTRALLKVDAPHTWSSAARLAVLVRQTGARLVNFHYGSNFVSLKDVLGARLGGTSAIHATLHMAVGWDQLGERKRKATRLAARYVSKFIAISRETEIVLRQAGVPQDKIELVYCGVAAPAPTSREFGRKRFGIPEDAFVVLSASRLVPFKGVLEVVQACAQALPACPDIVLMVAGDGSERLPLEREARRLLPNRVVFLGAVADRMEDAYAAADVFAMASSMEGLPLVYIEAAMQGVPSIASDTGGTREVVLDGETGIIVPPRDAAATADAITRLHQAKALRESLGAAAKVRSMAAFTEARMIEDYCRLFGLEKSG